MKVEIKLSKEVREPYVEIYAKELTQEIINLVGIIEGESDSVLTAKKNDKYFVISLEDISMIRIEDQKATIYSKNEKYTTNKRLYELENQLGQNFLRISKTTLINLKKIASVEPSFNGMMLLNLKCGCSDYISRKYLPDLKKYLGL